MKSIGMEQPRFLFGKHENISNASRFFPLEFFIIFLAFQREMAYNEVVETVVCIWTNV